MYLTQTKLSNLQINLGAVQSNSRALKDLIEDDIKEKQPMRDGTRYYNYKQDILDKNFSEYYTSLGEVHEDPNASNNKIINPIHFLLVNQKVEFALSSGVKITGLDEKIIDSVYKTLGNNFDVTLMDYSKSASNNGLGWLMVYIDRDGQFRTKVVDSKEIIPVWDDRTKTLIQVIRYYKKSVVLDGASSSPYVLEIWNDRYYDIYEEQNNGEFVLTSSAIPHFTQEIIKGNIIESTPMSWGKLPFIQLKNNSEKSTDLEPIKSLVDDLDLNLSDLSNSLADNADAIWVLTGYPNENLGRFRKNLKNTRAIAVDERGNARPETLNIPIEARKEALKMLVDQIYSIGRGVNMNNDKFGNSPSGIALQFLYSGLIQKCNTLIRNLESSLYDLMWFVNRYFELNPDGSNKYSVFDPYQLVFAFEYAMPTNALEKAQISLIEAQTALTGIGIFTKEFIAKMHPLTKDLSEDMISQIIEINEPLDLDTDVNQ